MARNGTGTYAVPNSFTPSTTISSAAVNANFSDAGDEITNSVAADGQTTITGALKGANGSAATPSYGFAADTNTGMYRKGADSLGFATAGVERAYIDSAGKLFALDDVDVAGDLTVTGAITGHVIGTDVQAHDDQLDDIAALTPTDGNIIVGNGSAWVAESGATARTSLGVVAASDTVAGIQENAVQSEMEAASSTTLNVTPGRQRFHPAHPKAWASVNQTGTQAVNQSSGISSVSDPNVGRTTFNFSTAFSAATYAFAIARSFVANDSPGMVAQEGTKSTTACTLWSQGFNDSTGYNEDSPDFCGWFIGDQ